MAQITAPERPAALFARLFSYYRHSFPASCAKALPALVVAGFEKKFGQGVLVCTFCRFSIDCGKALTEIDNLHYDHSPYCRSRRLDDSPLNHILQRLEVDLCASLSSSQFLFEDDLIRICSADPDFRELTFAFGQWGFASRLSAALLARNGFYYAVKKHAARCLACLLTLDSPNSVSAVEDWHRQHSPHCRYVARAAVDGWEMLRFVHDITGHIQEEGIEVVLQHSAALDRNCKLKMPMSRASHSPKPTTISRKRPLSSGLASLMQALNSVGLCDEEIRRAMKADASLIDCASSSEFLSKLAKPEPIRTSKETETTMRAGNMATIENFKCELCVDEPKNTSFLPCGHVYTCYSCALRVKYGDTAADRRCCICRRDVTDISPLLLTHEIKEH